MSIRSSIARTAFETLRSNPAHTLMSISGLVIGVAALVGVLSLADGMEDYAREQVNTTTDLQSINVSINSTKLLDGVRVRRSEIPAFSVESIADLQTSLSGQATAVLYHQRNTPVSIPSDSIFTATTLIAATEGAASLMPGELIDGRLFTTTEVVSGASVGVISSDLATKLHLSSGTSSILGRSIQVDSVEIKIIGVVSLKSTIPIGLLVPISVDGIRPEGSSLSLVVKADQVELVPEIKSTIQSWAATHFTDGADALSIQTNEMRVEQVQRGVLLFKIIMGLITGISVLVGGVGIMNVLMMSVKERTKEIGVRKAVGAKKAHIVFQFMVEAISISAVGCSVGLLTGLIAVYAVTPIIRSLTDVPFQAGFSIATLAVIALTAAVVGIVFGTYPAYSAAKLNPVDAMRYE